MLICCWNIIINIFVFINVVFVIIKEELWDGEKKVGLSCRVEEEEENVSWDECIWILKIEEELIYIIYILF